MLEDCVVFRDSHAASDGPLELVSGRPLPPASFTAHGPSGRAKIFRSPGWVADRDVVGPADLQQAVQHRPARVCIAPISERAYSPVRCALADEPTRSDGAENGK